MRPALPSWCSSVSTALLLAVAAPAQTADSRALLVAVVADGERATLLGKSLEGAGLRHRRVATSSCAPEALRFADVVIVDWSEAEAQPDALPFGELERWDRPTLFLDNTGEWVARRYGVLAATEMETLEPARRGPEMQRFDPPDDAMTKVWRQGNLFHFPAETEAVVAVPKERAWLVEVIGRAARFASDRPIVRHPVANGAALPAEEIARRERILDGGKLLGVEATTRDGLLALPAKIGGTNGDAAERLLVDVVADGPGPGTTRNNWQNWLKPRADELVWDDVSRVWRIDATARARDVASRGLIGDARGVVPASVEATALATKVAQKYGGRALADLTTFTCWQGKVHCSWDRRAGVFRAENHHVIPAGNYGTAWKLAVFDTFAEVDLIKGGGPRPRPTLSAAGEFRELIAHAFLPALLLDPSTSLELRPDDDDGELRALDVRLSMRGMAGARYRLWIAPDGTIARRQDLSTSRNLAWRLHGTTACGPLTLPSKWIEIDPKRPQSWSLAEPAWNPPLPANLATATECLTTPRAENESAK